MLLNIFSFTENLKKDNILTPKKLRLKEKIQINVIKKINIARFDVIILHNLKQK